MAEVLFTAPLYHKVHLSLPWTLFKLAEQISTDDGEIMTMNVTDPNESMLCVNVHRKTEAGEEKLIIEVTDPEGLCEQSLVEADEESWRFNLGRVQSPVYLQRDDRMTSIHGDLLIKAEISSGDDKSLCKIENVVDNPDQVHIDKTTDEEDKVMYISSDNLVQLLDAGDLVVKNEENAVQDRKVQEVMEVRELLADESSMLQRSAFSCMNPDSQENVISRDTDMLDINQDADAKNISDGLGIDENSVDHFGVSDGVVSESSQMSILPSDSVVVVEHQPSSGHQLMSVHDENMDHFIILAPGEVADISCTATELVRTCDSKWNMDNTEVGKTDQVTDLRHLGLKSSEADVNLMTEPTQGKTVDLASEPSIMVQSVKDIPRIVVDVEAFKCPACVKKFYTMEVLQGHFQRLHRDCVYSEAKIEKVIVKGAYLCFICRHPFHRFDAVRKHLEAIHKLQMERRKIARQNVCPLCSSKHSSLRTLRCHLNYKHQDDPRYKETLVAIHTQICNEHKPKQDNRILLQCPFCLVNLRFKQFVHHLRIAHQDDPNYEEILKQSKQAMKEQKRKKLHETTKECKYCHKEFPLTRFYSHLRNVHRAEQNDDYKCPICGKTFHSNWHLNMHKLIHSEEKSQKCDICGRRFRHIYSLKKHKRTIHLKEYPFPCQVCGRGFHTRTLFRSHRCKPKPELAESKTCDGQLTDVELNEGEIITAESTIDIKSVNGDIYPTLAKGVADQEFKSYGIATVPTPKDVLSMPVHNTGPAVRALALKSVTAQGSSDQSDTAINDNSMVNHNSVVNTDNAQVVDFSNVNTAETSSKRESSTQNKQTGQSHATHQLYSQIVDSQDKYRHLDDETGNQVCNICEKQFKNLMSISAHLRRVHHISRKPITKYTCTICGRDFLLQSKLNTHMHTHEDQSIECKQCGRRLRGKYLLEKHIRVVHHRRYVYYCSVCGRGFEKQRCLKEHCCGRRGVGSSHRNQLTAGDEQRTDYLKVETCGEGDRSDGNTQMIPRCTKSKDACEAMLALSASSVKVETVDHQRPNCKPSGDDLVPAAVSDHLIEAGQNSDLPSCTKRKEEICIKRGDCSGIFCGSTEVHTSETASDISTDKNDDCLKSSQSSDSHSVTDRNLAVQSIMGNCNALQNEVAYSITIPKETVNSRVINQWNAQIKCRSSSGNALTDSTSLGTEKDVTPQKRSKRIRNQPTWLKAYNS